MKRTLTLITLLTVFCTLTFIAGCGSVGETPLDRRSATTRLEPQDVRRTVEAMVESMLSDEVIFTSFANTTAGDDKRPIIDIEPMQNRTSHHIDMAMITEGIRTQLIRSRKFRFTSRASSGTDAEILDEQANAGLVDPNKAVRAGQQIAAQMYLTGSLSEIRNQSGRTTDQYFRFTMTLKDLRTGEIAWTDEKEIRKEQTRAFLGR